MQRKLKVPKRWGEGAKERPTPSLRLNGTSGILLETAQRVEATRGWWSQLDVLCALRASTGLQDRVCHWCGGTLRILT